MQDIYIHDTIKDIIYYIVAVSNVSADNRTTITQYPTSEGANISDHAYNEPKTVNLNFSISKYNSNNGFYYKNSDNSRIKLSYDETKELIKTWDEHHVLLNLQTLNDKYDNLLISGYNLPEAAELGTLNYNINLQEIRIAKIKTINVPIEKSASDEDQVNDNVETSTGTTVANIIGSTAGGAAVGALAGAAVGSVIPVIGTSLGAGVGAIVGAVGGFFNWLIDSV